MKDNLLDAKKAFLDNLNLTIPFILFYIFSDAFYLLSDRFLADSFGDKQGLVYLYSAVLLVGQVLITFTLFTNLINKDGGKLSFSDLPYYIWANIKFTVLILAGAVCLLLPAFGVILFCFMGPLISIADDKCDSPFKESFRIVKENARQILPVALAFGFLSLLDEASSMYFVKGNLYVGIFASVIFSSITIFYYYWVYSAYRRYKLSV